MSLSRLNRNARRAINYNLPGQLPMVDSETLAQAIARGERIAAEKQKIIDDAAERLRKEGVDEELVQEVVYGDKT